MNSNSISAIGKLTVADIRSIYNAGVANKVQDMQKMAGEAAIELINALPVSSTALDNGKNVDVVV